MTGSRSEEVEELVAKALRTGDRYVRSMLLLEARAQADALGDGLTEHARRTLESVERVELVEIHRRARPVRFRRRGARA